MTRTLRRLASFSLAAALALSVPLAAPASADAASDAQRFVTLLNGARTAAGLPALAVDARLSSVATSWSGAMAASNHLAHNPNLAAQAPTGWTRVTENVGYGPSVDQVHKALMASPGHRANIHDGGVNAVGVGVAFGGGSVWVTQIFMKNTTVVTGAPQVVGTGPGYRLVSAAGGVWTFGTAADQAGATSPAPFVGGASTPSGHGFWIVDAAGRVDSRGDAPALGGLGGALAAPIVGMAATPSGRGYWLLGRDGGVFSFGDAAFYGSTGGIRLNQPVVGLAATPTGRGYWFVAADGGIFAFGDAAFGGSTGALRLNQPIVGMAAHPSGRGYWLVARDGGVFAFNAPFLGSTGAIALNQPIVGMTSTASGNGYRFVAADGGIFSFGDAAFRGSAAGAVGSSIVGMVAAA